eukprot:14927478-Heterocapsa_arctica.AAC.1
MMLRELSALLPCFGLALLAQPLCPIRGLVAALEAAGAEVEVAVAALAGPCAARSFVALATFAMLDSRPGHW